MGTGVAEGERRVVGESEDERGSVIERTYEEVFADPQGDLGIAGLDWLDITTFTVGDEPGDHFPFRLAGPAIRPLPDPGDRWIAYGLVLDTDADGRPDVRVGMDNIPGGGHREWQTDLSSGATVANSGPPYGSIYPVIVGGYEDTYDPGEDGLDGGAFRFGELPPGTRAYLWSSLIEDGRIVATDDAPDREWIAVDPTARA